MLNVEYLQKLAAEFCVPFEDALFIALNLNGIDFNSNSVRMRAQLHLGSEELFNYAQSRKESDYFFALPVQAESPFKLKDDVLLFDGYKIGKMIGVTDDTCTSHYWRRGKTSININPNRRTKCHGCEFCYAIYQIPEDNKKLVSEDDFDEFFKKLLSQYNMTDLSDLIEISVVTGCYEDGEHLIEALRNLKNVAKGKYGFKGRIFYLGSQINTKALADEFANLGETRLCYSVETFERRELLKPVKRDFELSDIINLMDYAMTKSVNVNFAYVLGLESLDIVQQYFKMMADHINVFPIVNILQIHKGQSISLRTDGADDVRFYLEARKKIEEIFYNTPLRPEVWNNFRSLWTLKFANEELTGVRIP